MKRLGTMRTHRSELERHISGALGVTSLLVVTADQLTKIWIRLNLPLGRSLLSDGFFRITHAHNPGTAFGLFPDQSFLWLNLAAGTTILLLVFVVFFLWWVPSWDNIPGKLALGLVIGGALGNLIDRLLFGYVTDFINIGIWPGVFNIADLALRLGIIMLIYFLWMPGTVIKGQSGPVFQ